MKDIIDQVSAAFNAGDFETVAKQAQRYGRIIRDVSWDNENGSYRQMHIALGAWFYCFTKHNGQVSTLERMPRRVN